MVQRFHFNIEHIEGVIMAVPNLFVPIQHTRSVFY